MLCLSLGFLSSIKENLKSYAVYKISIDFYEKIGLIKQAVILKFDIQIK